jgi:hypothetical protein
MNNFGYCRCGKFSLIGQNLFLSKNKYLDENEMYNIPKLQLLNSSACHFVFYFKKVNLN